MSRATLCLALLASIAGAQKPYHSGEGESDGDNLGLCVALAGDVDKDGMPDYVVGAPRDDGKAPDSGSVWIHSGRDGKLLRMLRGVAGYDQFGYAVAGAGDVNADGYADVIVGAPYEDNNDGRHTFTRAGSAQVFSGRDGKVLHTFRGEGSGAALGWSVAGVGDLDRDGHDDVAAAAPFYRRGKVHDVGRVRVWSGKTGALLHDLQGKQEGDRFGWSVCRIEDLDRDGVPELLVGVEGSADKGDQAGAAQLFSGRRARLLRELRSGQTVDYFGKAVASAGDVDDDGRDDLLVGGWNARNPDGIATGMVLVVSGRSRKPLHTIYGEAEHDRFGSALAGMGDVDGDGHADFAVGAPQDLRRGGGLVTVFSGKTAEPITVYRGEAVGDGFGTSVAGVGDHTNDGVPDLLVGVPGRRGRGGWLVLAGVRPRK